MRRGLVHALAWSLATGGAVTLSWWGVHTVLAGTVYDPPRALPIPTGMGTGTAVGSDPLVSSTHASGSPTATPSANPATTPPTSAPATPPSRRPTTPAATPSAPGGTGATPGTAGAGNTGNVKSYGTDGGRAVFDLGPSSAELVNATPESGWQMQVWKQPTWIRVTFTKDSREISVFCVWHDTAPRVEIEERAT
ncbi:hypothetical protein ACFW6S_10385 [Streptomyces sp. NPDC058740]|uniref:hypothetical protein n=1 Tax=Streptomyces sp. NPDC058740 TaxID=3346619 RepID=UPI003696510B